MDLVTFFNRPSLATPKRSAKNFGYCHNLQPDDAAALSLIVTGGTYYDKGYWYGFYMGRAMQLLATSILRFISRIGLGVSGRKLNKEQLYQEIHKVYEKVNYDRLEELQGIVDGAKAAGHPFEDERDTAALLTFFEINEAACCSTSAVMPPLSTQNTYQINSVEYPFRFDFQKYPCLLLHFPQDENGNRIQQATFLTSYAGLLGSTGGINEKGVAYGSIRSSNLKDPSTRDGVTHVYVIDEALREATNTVEMVEHVKKRQKTNAYYFVVSDPLNRPDSLNLWFYGPKLMEVYRAGEMANIDFVIDKRYGTYEPIAGGVYWMDMPTPGAEAGPEKVLESFKRYQGRIQDAEALTIAKELGSRYTVVSAVFNSTTMQAWISYSLGRTPAHERAYHHLDVGFLLDNYEEFLKGNFEAVTSRTLSSSR